MRRAFSILVVAVSALTPRAQQAEPQRASIRVQVLTFLGDPLEGATVTLIEQGTRKEVRGAFGWHPNHYAADVPFGEYLLRVSSGGTRPHEQALSVHQPHLSFRVFMRLARFADETPSVVVGTVKAPLATKGTLWVKTLPLLSNQSLGETQVQSDGSFRLVGLDNGEYVLVVMRGTKAEYLKQVSLYGLLDVQVSLP